MIFLPLQLCRLTSDHYLLSRPPAALPISRSYEPSTGRNLNLHLHHVIRDIVYIRTPLGAKTDCGTHLPGRLRQRHGCPEKAACNAAGQRYWRL